MSEEFCKMVDKGLTNVPHEVSLNLPKLKKIKNVPKLKLPKLKKVEL